MVVIKLPGEQGTTGEIYLAYLMAFPIILSTRLKEDYSTPILKEKKRWIAQNKISSCNMFGKWIQKRILRWSNETQSQI